jgi:hypothetical protein
MPIEVGIWRLGDKIERVKFEPMPRAKWSNARERRGHSA